MRTACCGWSCKACRTATASSGLRCGVAAGAVATRGGVQTGLRTLAGGGGESSALWPLSVCGREDKESSALWPFGG
eukprot:351027-Chlamydomonas_euryale.AAC.2